MRLVRPLRISALTLALAAAPPASPQPNGGSIVVANCNDAGQGSLRDAIATAPEAGHIDLSQLTCSTITLTSGAITINQQYLYLDGPGASALTIDGNSHDRIFNQYQFAVGYLDIEGLSLAHGASAGDGGCVRTGGYVRLVDSAVHDCRAHAYVSDTHGGAVYAYSIAMSYSSVTGNVAESESADAIGGGIYTRVLRADASVVADNSAVSQAAHSNGGGAYITRELDLIDSTVSGNRAAVNGGILVNGYGNGGSSMIGNSTISGNIATDYTGGLATNSYLEIRNSTVAFNCASTTPFGSTYHIGIGLNFRFSPPSLLSTIIANNGFCVARGLDATPQDQAYDLGGQAFSGSITGSNNLIMIGAVTLPPDTIHADPQLLPLRDNGGPTRTHALSGLSPAVDTGNDADGFFTFDQRGPGFPRTSGANTDIGAFELNNTDLIFASGFEPLDTVVGNSKTYRRNRTR